MKKLPIYYRRGTVIYDTCTSHTSDADLEKRLSDSSVAVAQAEMRLWKAWEDGDPTTYVTTDPTTIPASREDLKGVYSRVLRDGAQRTTYDQIMGLANEICPQCGVNKARTLDHYLPQSAYPELSVIPANLVPVCGDCNFFKRSDTPKSISDCVYNPYYDDWSEFELFSAVVNFDPIVSITFLAASPAICPPVILSRAKKHFDVFQLSSTFAVATAGVLASIKKNCEIIVSINQVIGQSPRSGIEYWASEQLKTARSIDASSWQTALYEALSTSEEFLNGGYNKIVAGVILKEK